MRQITDTLLMIETTGFDYNPDTAKTNKFQYPPMIDKDKRDSNSGNEVSRLALAEFRDMVGQLRKSGIKVLTFKDRQEFYTPDAIFPNNWFSTHENGMIITYPMAVCNRRAERREDIIESLCKSYGYNTHISLEKFEYHSPALFLEGTGSVVFDRVNQIAFAAQSPRTDKEPFLELCKILDHLPVIFKAYGPANEPIYHTNVMLSIGETFAVVGMEVIDKSYRSLIENTLQGAGRDLIKLTTEQIYKSFAGNMLQVRNNKGETVLLISKTGLDSLNDYQVGQLKEHNDHILPVSVPIIEQCGGGSVRCMVAEVFRAGSR